MTYIELINRFWDFYRVKKFSDIDTAIYFFLLNECNIRRWLNPFELQTRNIEICFSISRKTIGEARNRLKQRGLIDFIEAQGRGPTTYLFSGRQGDPGQSKFYLSLEDDLMRLFGSERVMSMYSALNIPEGEEIRHKTITSFIEKAQKKIENNNFGIRKNLLDYDEVMNEQREVIYKERRRVLEGESMRDVIFKMINDTAPGSVAIAKGMAALK